MTNAAVDSCFSEKKITTFLAIQDSHLSHDMASWHGIPFLKLVDGVKIPGESFSKPNGFADHYPFEKWLFHWEYTLFSDKPICQMGIQMGGQL